MTPDQLSKLSSIAEIFSSIAILATLIFVLVEIRQNTQAIEQNAAWMRLASLDAGYEQFAEFRRLLLTDNEVFRLWEDGCSSELSGDEARRYDIIAEDWLFLQRNVSERSVALAGRELLDAQAAGTAARINRCPRLRSIFEDFAGARQISPEWYSAVSEAINRAPSTGN